ncbi:MAG: amino acid adenylation domain-containing protein, partial [Gammaproteobacteria bacterium]|nr:amino acid adenylation domain-containing protein [Gammaproteobacteria bacterium]
HLTYRELNQRADQLARYLQKLGVEPDTLVGVYIERSPEVLIGLLGILKAGGAYVPLDPTYPSDRLAFMLADAQVRVLLTHPPLCSSTAELLAATGDQTPGQPPVVVDLAADWPTIVQTQETPVTDQVTATDLAYVIYTSGSTGHPKGVQLEHQSVVNFLLSMAQAPGIKQSDRLLAVTTISFDIAVLELFLPLSIGAAVEIVSQSKAADGRRLLEKLPSATVMQATPATWQMLLAAGWSGSPHLKILCGGEALTKPLARQLLRRGRSVWNMYGPTETTIWSTISKIKDAPEEIGIETIGRPIANTQLYILDGNGQPTPVGVVGQLHIGGKGLARGYRNRPDLTSEAFIPNPFGEGKLYRTGDLARYLPDGTIEFLGRSDHQVKVRGFRIELGEIEATLAQHPAVIDSVVVVREDQVGDKRLITYLSTEERFVENDDITSELRIYLQQKLPEYMVPAGFVMVESFPLTPSGKIDRQALPAPNFTIGLSAGYVAPGTPTEATLAAIWTDTLGVPQVGIHDNFFELGGHSLLAMQLVAQIQRELQVNVPLQAFFSEPTIAGLAGRIETLEPRGDALPGIVPVPEKRYHPFPLTDVQQAYWLGRSAAFALGQIATHIYLEIEMTGPDLARLQWAWQQLIARHEMLQMVIRADGRQQILESVPDYEIEITDLRGQAEDFIAAQLETIRQELSHQVLTTDQWPMFELRATRLNDTRTRLHLSFDALLADGWGFQILAREWPQLYHNPEVTLPALELSFRDYVLTEQRLLESTLYQQAQEYWFGRLDDFAPPPALPLAQDPTAISQPEFKRRQGRLESEQWQALKQRAGQAGLTPSTLLLAAFAEVLTYWSKSPRFTINLTLFNRLPLHPQVNDIVGDFTSLTLLEVDNGGGQSFKERSQRLQHQLWQDLDHRYVSGVRVLRELSRRQGQQVLMPVVFTSTLGLETNEAADLDQNEWGELVYGISQTPQVWLDHQVMEQQGALNFNWDAVEALFPEELLDDMFAAYCTLLDLLATSDDVWEQAAIQLLPESQLVQRATVNNTATSISEEMLHTL